MWNILIVDDEPRIAEGLQHMISWCNPKLTVAKSFGDAISALEYLRGNWREVSLLITDICMPQMNGLELISQVRSFAPNLPCLILTGYGEFEYAKQAISLGVVNYLLKPIDLNELKDTLDRLIFTDSAPHTDVAFSDLSSEVRYIKKEIESNYATFDMNAIAEYLQLRKDYLSRIFKQETGINISDYLMEVRLQHARELLSEPGKYKVYEVCEKIGYKDVAYFSKIFRQKYHVSPKDFQKHVAGSRE